MTVRSPTALLVAVLVAAGALGGVPRAWAEPPRGTVIEPVVGTATPPLPDPVLVRTARSGDGLVVVNPTAVPLTVAGPDGRDFVRISAAGVESDAAAPFTYLSRHGRDTAVTLPRGVADAAPPRWRRVSTDISWQWHDPRLRPYAGLPPVGGRSDARQILARWTVPLRYGALLVTVDGTLEAVPAPEPVRIAVDPIPAGLTAVAAVGGLTVAAPTDVPVELRGIEGEDFLRHSARGWEVATASTTHRLDLLAADRPVPPGAGWQPVPGGHVVTWSDPRLDPGTAATMRWRIPIEVAGLSADLTGTATRSTSAAAGPRAVPGRFGPAALAPAVLLLAVVLGALLRRDRRLADGGADPPATPAGPGPS